MDNEVIAEKDLGAISLLRFDRILAVPPGERLAGVMLYEAKRLAPLMDPLVAAKVTVTRTLLVETERSDDELPALQLLVEQLRHA
ncbi:hypothetical protein [Halopseudomonas aestusnigri]|uniref:hypothetical protein n=1 Tax=Halopseudomonas aestusnigri TaxID=857252 RepID=UPI0030021161